MTPAADYSMEAYENLLRSKIQISKVLGFEVSDEEVHPSRKPHQRVSIRWGVRGGRRAIFMSFGLGKTGIQLQILRLILNQAGGRALIVAPLGVQQEFFTEAAALGIEIQFIRSIEESGETGIYITNYETVRDGKLDPAYFTVTTLDEAAILASFGGTKTFREFMRLFAPVPYRFVATATPDPNEYLELLAYADYLGILDIGQAKTRWFKRNAKKADNLTLRPDKAEEFWLWVSSWALFVQKPSDLGFSDEGYALPPLRVIHHVVRANDGVPVADRSGQYRMIRDSSLGVTEAAREKRESLDARIAAVRGILDEIPGEHVLLWHDLEDERRALERAVPGIETVYGAQRSNRSSLEKLEKAIVGFANGEIQYLGAKPSMFGAGANFQRHCHTAIFCGVSFSFRNFIQAVHRIYRFLQDKEVTIHLVYSESERSVVQILMEKWERYKEQVAKMAEIIKEYGLSELALAQALTRSIGVERVEITGPTYRIVNNDCVLETKRMDENSIGLVLTSIPFSSQFEYSPSYNDFGHNEDNEQFFQQLDFLTHELFRVLIPGRVAAIHVKDRVVPGGMTGLGVQSIYPFHSDCIRHFIKHGFTYMGMKTIVTDVVREHKQTYRLGYSEQCKDATKMGCGLPEYLLLFRKPQTDRKKGYGDIRVKKTKARYSKARWQVEAHGFTRSSGNRNLTPDEIVNLPHKLIFGMFHDFYLQNVYDFEHHVKLGEALERRGRLPSTFMLLQPPSWHPEVWTDITRMLTANAFQAAKGRQKHLCAFQFDLVDRVIIQMSNEGDVVYDPFGGLMTVPARAVALGRVGIGAELNGSYFIDGAMYCKAAADKVGIPGLFDVVEREAQLEGVA